MIRVSSVILGICCALVFVARAQELVAPGKGVEINEDALEFELPPIAGLEFGQVPDYITDLRQAAREERLECLEVLGLVDALLDRLLNGGFPSTDQALIEAQVEELLLFRSQLPCVPIEESPPIMSQPYSGFGAPGGGFGGSGGGAGGLGSLADLQVLRDLQASRATVILLTRLYQTQRPKHRVLATDCQRSQILVVWQREQLPCANRRTPTSGSLVFLLVRIELWCRSLKR